MLYQRDFRWLVNSDYPGRILCGNYSWELKNRVAECIISFRNFDNVGNQVIPYISAWEDEENKIWHEFAGRRLMELLDCGAAEVTTVFSDSITGRSAYKCPGLDAAVTKETMTRLEMGDARPDLRKDCKQSGNIEAVYKIATKTGRHVWLKDQASVEVFAQDKICLSLGVLTIISKEMEAEEQLKKAESELQRHRRHLEELVKERTRELWKTQLEIVHRLARAAEYRDNITGMHIARMSHYCAILGQAAGLGEEESELLFHATSMHDIGKIGIGDNILLKPGKLDEDEFEQMKTHSSIGAKLLSGHNSELLKLAGIIALTHHERWNGSGYPQGLSRDAIPFAGRIVAVCDVFDALTSERPYKKDWPVEDAIIEIKKEKGQHFDPQLVDLFIQHLPQILNTKEKFADHHHVFH